MKQLWIILCIALIVQARPSRAFQQTMRDSVSDHTPEGWSERGVFGFNGLVFDFRLGRWAGGWLNGALKDCSDAAWFCMSSGSGDQGNRFQLALPRDCDVIEKAREGDIWTLGPVRTQVLGIRRTDTPGPHGAANTTLYLGDPRIPNIIYEYDAWAGVTMIFWDIRKNVNFVELASKNELSNWLKDATVEPQKGYMLNPRSTFDPFGKCG